MSWNALIVDDEALSRSNLQLALAEYPTWACVGSCPSAAAARVVLSQHHVDLLLLDIRMPRQHGLSFAAELAREAKPPLIVFVTAFDEHAVAAFEVFALDYLLKPFDDARFSQMMDRVLRVLSWQSDTLRDTHRAALQGLALDQLAGQQGQTPPALREIIVRSIGGLERVAVADVQWLSAAGNYVTLHLPGRKLLHRATLGAMEARLPAAEFMRVHRTAVVRRAAIQSVHVSGDSTYFVRLLSEETVPVSERHIDAVRALFQALPPDAPRRDSAATAMTK